MKRMLQAALLAVAMAGCAGAQVAHPRIWLDTTTRAQLQALVAANDPTWVALKAKADQYLGYTVPAYDRSACGNNQICYTYQGSGYYEAIFTLGLAYQMTHDPVYAAKAKVVLAAMEAAGAQAEAVDVGYPSRYLVVAFALAYDWFYDQYSDAEKTAAANLLDAYWTQVMATGYAWSSYPNPYNNYTGGHIIGFGLAGIAFEGDSATATTIQNYVLSKVQTLLIPAMRSGGFQGGGVVEGYNYGPYNMLRLIQYFVAMRTAGKDNLIRDSVGLYDYMDFCRASARNALYALKPNRWSVIDEGDFPGSFAGLAVRMYYPYLASFLGDTAEGQWMRYLANHLGTPTGGWPSSTDLSVFDAFLSKVGGTLSTPAASMAPRYYFSPGDWHTFVRSDWTDSAVHTMFNGAQYLFTDHQNIAYGHITINRQNDYLLVSSGQYNGYYGWYGSPAPFNRASWKSNILFVSDLTPDGSGGTFCKTDAEQYIGCQSVYTPGNYAPLAHLETNDYVYSKADLAPGYTNNRGARSLSTYVRTFLNIGGDISFVFDRATAVNLSATRKLLWHVPTYGATSTLNGNIASNTFGDSTLWISTVLPAAANIKWVQDTTLSTTTTTQYTQRLEVSDPNAGTNPTTLFLTVLAPVAAGKAQAAYSLVDAVTMKGAVYDDGVFPRVAMFSTDGTAQTSVSYYASYTAGVTARHVVLDLKPGVYTVRRDGNVLYRIATVQNDGSLTFVATGGGTFSLSPTSMPAPGLTGKTVLVGTANF